MPMEFDMPKEKSSIIKVIGVGGGGSNAVNNMFQQGIKGVNFVVCNTDQQALDKSPISNKIQLGPSLTEGRGAGSKPVVGREATEESIEEIKELLSINTKMAFITAGMGGGTGTGGAPVIAELCREMGILTVGIVSEPFSFEGRRRAEQAKSGIEELRKNVDTLIVICNDKLRKIYSNQTLREAFRKADEILATAARGIAEIITVPGYINVDFEDVKTVMTNSGVALMGSAEAEGEHRAMLAVEAALSSPLLSDNDISGAKNILLNITSGTNEVLMDEIDIITEYLQSQAGNETDIIWGNCHDESLGEKICVTVIATGFEAEQEKQKQKIASGARTIIPLNDKETETNGEYHMEGPELTEEEQDENQFTFDFQNEPRMSRDIDPYLSKRDEKRPPVKEDSNETPALKQDGFDLDISTPASATHPPMPDDEQMQRIRKLRQMSSVRFNNPEKLRELEEEPAYKRRQVELNDVPHSSEQSLSRMTLSETSEDEEGENKRVELRKNNSYLHDSVD